MIDKYFRAVFSTTESVNFSQHIHEIFTKTITHIFHLMKKTQCSIISFKIKLDIYKKCLKLVTYDLGNLETWNITFI